MTNSDALVVTSPWEEVVHTAKYERMLVRRNKILQRLPAYQRQLHVLELLLAGLPKDELILEVACGMGFHLLELSSMGWSRITGLEIDPQLSQLTADAATQFDLQVQVLTGDACYIPLADGCCTAVFSQSFFEHVYDVDIALREQVRVLKPGGRLLILDGNLLNPYTVADLLFRYPFRTQGQHGGLKWLLNKDQVYHNLYGYLPLGRDEAIQTPGWWARRIKQEPGLKLKHAVTGGYYTHQHLPYELRRFSGGCLVWAVKE